MFSNGLRRLEVDFGSLEELLAELLAHWVAAGWLADGLAGLLMGWPVLAGRLAGHRDSLS